MRLLTIPAMAAIGLIGFGLALLFDTGITVSQPGPDSLASTDPVVASFEREFNRKPGRAKPPLRSEIADDELYRAINSVHWTANAKTGPVESHQSRRKTSERHE